MILLTNMEQDNELLLFDRVNVIKDTINKYGENNFYLSFSGGKDSTILHYLIDMALPNNKIPRVFINTGIEYTAIVEFVKELAEKDDRFVIIQPKVPVKKMLEEFGYPFKSKEHSYKVSQWKKGLRSPNLIKYATGANTFACPPKLQYQFTDEFKLKISSQCCNQMKKKPIHEWEKENNCHIAITGMRNEEGGQRANIKGCILTDKYGKVYKFHPLMKVNQEFEDWFAEKEKIKFCKLYYPPFNFVRTGCRGCPFALKLQEQLDVMGLYLPAERRACEIIWKPVYDEYRRIGYRLKDKITIFD